jgi:hypothetical protein
MDTRPFPANLRVWVKNGNKPEPESDDRFSGTCTFQYDGELYDFPPGKAVLLTPEQAWWMFLWDTRADVARNGSETPRNYRDKMSTSAMGNSGMGSQITLWEQKLAALGWTRKDKAQRFDRFEFKTVNLNQTISAQEWEKIQ